MAIPSPITALIVLTTLAGTIPAPAEESPSSPRLLFRSICENPKLAEVLVYHPIAESSAHLRMPDLAGICIIADYGFYRHEIDLELFPAAGMDRLWVFDESPVSRDSLLATPLLQFEMHPGTMHVTGREFQRTLVPADREISIRLEIDGSRLDLSWPGATGGPDVRRSISPGGPVYLGVPTTRSDCRDCVLALFRVYASGDGIADWNKTIEIEIPRRRSQSPPD